MVAETGQDGAKAMSDGIQGSRGVFRALRLKPGEDPIDGLRAAFDAGGIAAGAVLTCVGSLTRAAIRHANRPETTIYQGHFEITSLVGTVDPAGEHLHVTITDGDGRAFGGHLMRGSAVYTTAEIVLLLMPDLVFARAPCPASGYDELTITRRTGTEE